VKPQVPLFLRPPIYSTKLCDLKRWHDWAKGVSLSIGSTFVQSDNGADSNMLCRELKWLMEDAVEDHSLGMEDDDRVKMRIAIEELYCLWTQRVQERRPFQYVVGCEHWRDLVLSVQEGVLIPRPETELVVDFVSDVVSENEDLRSGVWADLGTGSGALAIGICGVLGSEGGRVIATDLSPVAVAVATYNVQRYCLQVRDSNLFQSPCCEFLLAFFHCGLHCLRWFYMKLLKIWRTYFHLPCDFLPIFFIFIFHIPFIPCILHDGLCVCFVFKSKQRVERLKKVTVLGYV